jgi:hypothetical protein
MGVFLDLPCRLAHGGTETVGIGGPCLDLSMKVERAYIYLYI